MISKLNILLLALLSLLPLLQTQDFSDAEIKEILAAHNVARAAKCQPPLTWDPKAAIVAKNYAATCPSGHNSNRDSQYQTAGGKCDDNWPYCSSSILGENIAWMTAGTLTQFVNLWVNEEKQWNCGTLPSYQSGTGHYTQVVWDDTYRVGCGRYTNCNNMEILVCDYFPPGNFNPDTNYAFPPKYCNGNCNNNSAPTLTSRSETEKSTTTRSTSSHISSTTSKFNENGDWFSLNNNISAWKFDETQLTHVGNSVDTLIKDNVSNSSGDYFIVAKINPSIHSYSSGILTGYKTGHHGVQYMLWRKIESGTFEYCFVYDENKQEKCTSLEGGPLSKNSSYNMMLRYTKLSDNNHYTLYIDQSHFISVVVPEDWMNGNIGLIAQGNIVIDNYYVSDAVAVQLSVDCNLTDDQVYQLIANAAGISTEYLVGLVRHGCSKKRAIQTIDDVSVVIVGTGNQTSQDIAKKLKTSSTLSNVQILPESSVDLSSSPSIIALSPDTSKNSSFSMVVIIVIAIGGFLLVAGIVILVVFITKKKKIFRRRNNASIPVEDLSNDSIEASHQAPPEQKNDNDPKPEITPRLELIPPPPPPTARRGEIPDLPDKDNIPPTSQSFSNLSSIQNMSFNTSENPHQYMPSNNSTTETSFNNIPPPDNLPPPPPKIEDI